MKIIVLPRNKKLPLLKQAKSEGKITYFDITKLVIKKIIPTTGSRVSTCHASNERQSASEASEAVTTGTAVDVASDDSGVADGSFSAVGDGHATMATALVTAGAEAKRVSTPASSQRQGTKEKRATRPSK